ncbi:MAG: NAD-dependent epimerase/dehydratase family protein [Caulobacter sp.]
MTAEVRRLALLGSGGLLGPALVAHFEGAGWRVDAPGREEVDAGREDAVLDWLARISPDALIIAAAETGGVADNLARPADLFGSNLAIAASALSAARKAAVPRVLYCGSSTAYGDNAPTPLREEWLGLWPAESSHPGYGTAKLAGALYARAIRQQDGQDVCAVLLGNLYGPDARRRGARANVIPALIDRMLEAVASGARQVEIWGSGRPRRSFLHVADAALAFERLLAGPTPDDGAINLGSVREVTIAELAGLIASATGFAGELIFDASRPEGRDARSLDVSRLGALGFAERISLEEGLRGCVAARD